MDETTPVACTLTSADLAAQGERWERLIARAMTERAETADGLRMSFLPGAEDELRALVAVEAQCCPWAIWTVERDGRAVMLAVRSGTEGAAVLRRMFNAAP